MIHEVANMRCSNTRFFLFCMLFSVVSGYVTSSEPVAFGQKIHTETELKGHSGAILDLAFSPDGKILGSASRDTTAKLWDWRAATTLTELRQHLVQSSIPKDVKAIAFSDDGTLVATGGADMCVRIASVSDGRELHTLRGHQRHVSSVVFSPVDRTLVASCGYDRTVRLWDCRTEKCTLVLSELNGVVRSVAFSPDGKLSCRIRGRPLWWRSCQDLGCPVRALFEDARWKQ